MAESSVLKSNMLKAKVAYNKLTLDKLKQHAKDLEIKIPKDLTRKNEIVDYMIEQMIKFEKPLTLPTESQPHFVTSRPAKSRRHKVQLQLLVQLNILKNLTLQQHHIQTCVLPVLKSKVRNGLILVF